MSNFKCQISNKINNLKLEIGNWKLEIPCEAEEGFTLVELLLTIGIASIIFSFTTINLLRTQNSTSVAAAEELLIADLKSQQTKAMNGTDGGGSFGIHFDGSNTYTLFRGADVNQNPSTNGPVTIDENISFSCPACSNGDIVFAPINGETTQSVITVAHAGGLEPRTITINKYGVVTAD